MSKTFAITGMGRSGTQFLATTLDRSPSWTVQHEPGGKQSGVNINRRFIGADHYGEVNSYLRWAFMAIPVTKRAVLLRHPQQLVVSAYNKRKSVFNNDLKENFNQSLLLIDRYITEGVQAFRFEQYTRSPASLQQIVDHVGIDDLTITADLLKTPVNATPPGRKRAESLEHLPERLQEWYWKTLHWFETKYYDGIPA